MIKKLLILFVAISLLAPVYANNAINKNIDSSSFAKKQSTDKVTRWEFLSALLTLAKIDIKEDKIVNYFKDININDKDYNAINYAKDVKVAYGYPDGTFKKNDFIKKDEATSLIGNVISRNYRELKKEDITPQWAKYSYVKAINNDFIENNVLSPEGYLTKAEAVEMLTRVGYFIEKTYTDTPDLIPNNPVKVMLKQETLTVGENAYVNKVTFYNDSIVVEAGNLIPVTLESDLNSRKAKLDDKINFIADKDLSTDQGTLIYPAGTSFEGIIVKRDKSTWLDIFDKCRVKINGTKIDNDIMLDYSAVTYAKNGKLVQTSTKPKKRKKEISNGDYLINYKNMVAPEMKYKSKAGDKIFLLLTGDLVIKDIRSIPKITPLDQYKGFEENNNEL